MAVDANGLRLRHAALGRETDEADTPDQSNSSFLKAFLDAQVKRFGAGSSVIVHKIYHGARDATDAVSIMWGELLDAAAGRNIVLGAAAHAKSLVWTPSPDGFGPELMFSTTPCPSSVMAVSPDNDGVTLDQRQSVDLTAWATRTRKDGATMEIRHQPGHPSYVLNRVRSKRASYPPPTPPVSPASSELDTEPVHQRPQRTHPPVPPPPAVDVATQHATLPKHTSYRTLFVLVGVVLLLGRLLAQYIFPSIPNEVPSAYIMDGSVCLPVFPAGGGWRASAGYFHVGKRSCRKTCSCCSPEGLTPRTCAIVCPSTGAACCRWTTPRKRAGRSERRPSRHRRRPPTCSGRVRHSVDRHDTR
jgi:hypothetical protein